MIRTALWIIGSVMYASALFAVLVLLVAFILDRVDAIRCWWVRRRT